MAARSGRASILGVGRLLAGGFKYLLFFNVFQLYQGLLDMMIFFFWDGFEPASRLCFAANLTEKIRDWNIYARIWLIINNSSQFSRGLVIVPQLFGLGGDISCVDGDMYHDCWQHSPNLLVRLQFAWIDQGANKFRVLIFPVWLPIYSRSSTEILQHI